MKTPKRLSKELEDFNLKYEVGDKIILEKDDKSLVIDEIIYKATIMGGHTVMAWLVKHGSYYASRVRGKYLKETV